MDSISSDNATTTYNCDYDPIYLEVEVHGTNILSMMLDLTRIRISPVFETRFFQTDVRNTSIGSGFFFKEHIHVKSTTMHVVC